MNEVERQAFQQLRYRHRGTHYLQVLAWLHRTLEPSLYLEIGTRFGDSLDLAHCDSIAIDPEFKLRNDTARQRRRTLLFSQTSDSFFEGFDLRQLYPQGVDFAFVDGMHRFEYVLRDLMNVERTGHRDTVIVLHDVLPLNTEMTSRKIIPFEQRREKVRMWTGDVYKVLPILHQYRPDLRLLALDAPPTGLLVISGCDPDNRVLAEHYDEILREHEQRQLNDTALDEYWAQFAPVSTAQLMQAPNSLEMLGLAAAAG